nr:ATP synthase F0 subunit 8 [Tristichotrochus unicus]UZN92186.1 ATP synthase F0 subunit 8 [Tristichotrochus unicus]
MVVLGSSLIWWSFKTEYSLTGSTTSGPDNSVKTNPTKSWNW